MRTAIFAYKGYVGIKSHPSSEGIVAKPGDGNLGVVMESTGVDVSPEALDLLKKVKRSHDDLGEFDVFKAGDKIIVGWLGGYLRAFKPEDIEGSSTYQPSLLNPVEGVTTPQEFIDFIDNL